MAEFKFKINDIVKVKDITEKDVPDCAGGYVGFFQRNIGNIFKVLDTYSNYDVPAYILDCGYNYIWDERLLELADNTHGFKVGDKVVINPSCKVGDYYEGITLQAEMMFNDVATIERIDTDGTMRLNGKLFWYTSPMFVKCESPETTFKVGDEVKINPECKVGEDYEGVTLLDCMMFDGYKEICEVAEGGYGIMDDSGYKWWYSEEMLIKEGENVEIKDVNIGEVTLTRKELKDVVMEVAMEFITNPPKELDDGKAQFLLAMVVPIIGDKIAKKLFGEEKKEDE